MAFPISNIADVDIAYGGQTQSLRVFGRGLMVTSDDGIDPDPVAGRAVLFQSRQEVLDYTGGGAGAASVFPATSRVYLAADAFFRVDGNRGYPRGGLLIGRQVDVAIPGVVTGTGTPSVSDIQTAVAATGATFLIDDVDIAAADLVTLQTSVALASIFSDIADAFEIAIQTSFPTYSNATVAYVGNGVRPYEHCWSNTDPHRDDRDRAWLDGISQSCDWIRG